MNLSNDIIDLILPNVTLLSSLKSKPLPKATSKATHNIYSGKA